MTTILLSSNHKNLAKALTDYASTATVEAEFGEVQVEGNVVSLGHHGPRNNNPAPCLGDNLGVSVAAIGISHFDLDCLGGIARVLGVKEFDAGDGEDLFWQIAALVDTMGVHKLGAIKSRLWFEDSQVRHEMAYGSFDDQNRADYFFECSWSDAMDQLNAFWAWSESHRLFPARDGSVTSVTEFVNEALRILDIIIEGAGEEWNELYSKGQAWAAAKKTLDKESFLSESNRVVLRSSGQFCNHLYRDNKGVVAYNPEKGSVTMSLADPISGVNCCTIMQSLFGPTAGGHAGIAGSPRDLYLDLASARGCMMMLQAKIALVRPDQP